MLGTLKQLVYLDVSKNNLEMVDEQICGCESLQDLLLSNNALTQLPGSIGEDYNTHTNKHLTWRKSNMKHPNSLLAIANTFFKFLGLRCILVLLFPWLTWQCFYCAAKMCFHNTKRPSTFKNHTGRNHLRRDCNCHLFSSNIISVVHSVVVPQDVELRPKEKKCWL